MRAGEPERLTFEWRQRMTEISASVEGLEAHKQRLEDLRRYL